MQNAFSIDVPQLADVMPVNLQTGIHAGDDVSPQIKAGIQFTGTAQSQVNCSQPLRPKVLGGNGNNNLVSSKNRTPAALIQIRRAIDEHSIKSRQRFQQPANRPLARPKVLKIGDVVLSEMVVRTHQTQVGNPGLDCHRCCLMETATESCGQRLANCEILHGSSTEECLTERALRVGVDQQRLQSQLGESTSQVEAAGTLSAAPFLINERDNHLTPLMIHRDCHWQSGPTAPGPLQKHCHESVKVVKQNVLSVVTESWYEIEGPNKPHIVKREKSPSPPPLGIAQLTLIEHSLCPLATSVSLQPGLVHTSRYRYRDSEGRRRRGTATMTMPNGFSPTDEFHIWGMLALTLQQPKPELHFAATPHFILRELGSIDTGSRRGGKNYRRFRESIDRISLASYSNDCFYDPVRKIHDRRTFRFFSTRMPLDVDSSRLWHFYWDPLFFEFCLAIGGRLRFDLQVYRSLDPASRRLFLLLHKIFHSDRKSPSFTIRELMTDVLGYSPDLKNAKLRQKLEVIGSRLHEADVIRFSASDVRTARNGIPCIQFRPGQYFDDLREGRNLDGTVSSPLVDALRSLGFESRDAERICSRYDAEMLREWIDITIAKKERDGVNAFRRSPQAFLIDNLKHAASGGRTVPDWWRELRKSETRNDDRKQDRRILKQVQQRLVEDEAGHGTSSKSNSSTVRIGDILRSVGL